MSGSESEPSNAGKPSRQTGTVVRSLGMRLVEKAFQGGGRDPDSDAFDPSNFEDVQSGWWLDRILPANAARYFAVAFVASTLLWLIGLFTRLAVLGFEDAAAEVWRFVRDRQWQLQPLLLFIHFIILRLFKGIYGRNFMRAFTPLNVTPADVESGHRWLFGSRVNLLALILAAPFIVWDVLFVFSGEKFYLTIFGEGSAYVARISIDAPNAEALLLLGVWSLEWVLYGYYCYLMIAGAIVVRGMLKRHEFVDPVDLVLTERQYRPLFNVVAQAGTLIFLYGLIHLGYMLYAKSADSDIASLVVLVILLGVAFALTWSGVRGVLKTSVGEAVNELEKSYRATREKLATMVEVQSIEEDVKRIQMQLKMQLALQQLDYIQTKYENLGRRELLGAAFRMVAPVGGVAARLVRWGSLLAAIGIGGAAAFGGGGGGSEQKADPDTEAGAPAEAGARE